MNIDTELTERKSRKPELYYSNGDYYCSEAIIKRIKDEFGADVSDWIIVMA